MTTSSDVARASVDVTLDAATAFEVFTAEIGEWYVVNEYTVVDHTRTKSMRIEPWVGGRFIDVHNLETGEGIVCGRVIVWDPPRRRTRCERTVGTATFRNGSRVT